MQLAVSFDKKGEITLMFEPGKMKDEKVTVGYEPAKGENHHVLDVPKGLEGKPINELARVLRVDTSGHAPRLEAKR